MRRPDIALLPLCAWALVASTCSEYEVTDPTEVETWAPALEVSPPVVYFGGVPVGETATESFTLSNVGNAALAVDSVALSGSGAYAFLLPWSAVSVPPGASMTVEVTYTPGLEPDQAVVAVESDDPARPTLTIPLVGRGLYPLIHLDPNPLDFGSVIVCDQEDEDFSITNIGEADLLISNLLLQGATMTLDMPLELPYRLAPGEQVRGDVWFDPISLGPAEGMLWISSNEPAGDRTLSITGEGSWLNIDEWTDTFRQPQMSWDSTDILFFVDQSASMDDDKERLTDGFPDFIEDLDDDWVDWQVMVVTEDDGCANGGILTPDDPAVVSGFANGVWGGYGLLTESGMAVAASALSQTGTGGCNQGFLREDSRTLLVMVSDEADQSDAGWESLLATVQTVAPAAAVVAVVGDVPDGCATAQAGTGYYEAAMASDGTFLSICATEWSSYFERMGDLVTGEPTDTFPLSYPAFPDSIVVHVDGAYASNWVYDEAANSVVFTPRPSSGAWIEIYYEVRQDCVDEG